MLLPVIGSTPTTVHVAGRLLPPLPPPPPPPPPPLLPVNGAGAVGLMLTTVLLMGSAPPLAPAGAAATARLSAARPAVIVVRVRFMDSSSTWRCLRGKLRQARVEFAIGPWS